MGANLLGVHCALAIRDVFEAFEQHVDGIFGQAMIGDRRLQVVTHVLERLLKGRAARVFAHDQNARLAADAGGVHDFVGFFVLHHAILMNARLVREGVVTNDGFIRLHHHARVTADHT